ncbi:Uncharacterised protein [Vibrio cholerae]|nr:Uncharacterised protein [Vibrio cholerae]
MKRRVASRQRITLIRPNNAVKNMLAVLLQAKFNMALQLRVALNNQTRLLY